MPNKTLVDRINPQHIEAVKGFMNQCPFNQLVSIDFMELGIGYAIAQLNIEHKHLNPIGIIHGGVYGTLLDTVALWSVYLELEEGLGLVTLDLNISFLNSSSSGRAKARGQRIKIGKKVCLAEAVLVDEQEKLLAHATSKLMVTRGFQLLDSGGKPLPPKFTF